MASELEGVAALVKKLEALASPSQQASVLRAAAGAGMRPALKRARETISEVSPGRRALHRTYKGRIVSRGFAARSLKVVTRLSRDKTRAYALLGVGKEAYYAVLFQELGTAHIGRRPWLRPAFQQTQSEALAALADRLRKRVEKIARG